MTGTKAKALDLDELRALAKEFPTVRVDVAYRVNPLPSRYDEVLGRGAAFADKPSPAVYYLSSSGGYDPASKQFRARHALGIAYLAPGVGKLLRDAGYLDFSTRARSLARTVQDLEVEVRKHLPEQLAEIDRVEAERMAKAARKDAAKTLAGRALGLAHGLEQLGDVAGLGKYGFKLDIARDARTLAEFLSKEIPEEEKDEIDDEV